jgi:phospholipid-binding lipoprotein MlaA
MILLKMTKIHCGWKNLFISALMITVLSACASQPEKPTAPEADPWEGFNRNIHAFNDGLDRALLKPIAKGYDVIMPDAPQRGVRNFFRNLAYPVTFLNLILQGKFEDSLSATGRFLYNSTVGLLGFFDVATRDGIPDFTEDFGQTMAVWGWNDSRYLVAPIFGPTTVRDLAGRSFYGYLSPVSYMVREHNDYRPLILDIISVRASLLPFQKDLDQASDPYALIRDAFLQNREFNIWDEEPPAPDYDALLELE